LEAIVPNMVGYPFLKLHVRQPGSWGTQDRPEGIPARSVCIQHAQPLIIVPLYTLELAVQNATMGLFTALPS
jgi:hypothetical protein